MEEFRDWWELEEWKMTFPVCRGELSGRVIDARVGNFNQNGSQHMDKGFISGKSEQGDFVKMLLETY